MITRAGAFILVLLCLAAPVHAMPALGPRVFDLAASLVFPLYDETEDDARACTGFYVKPYSVMWNTRRPVSVWKFTAGHCVMHGIVVQRWSAHSWERNYPILANQVYAFDAGVLLGIEVRPHPVYAELLDRPLIPGEPVVSVGYGLRRLTNLLGRFTGDYAQGKPIVFFEQVVRGGLSGSPVFTMRGEIIGILTHGHWVDDGYAALTPIRDVVRVLRAVTNEFDLLREVVPDTYGMRH